MVEPFSMMIRIKAFLQERLKISFTFESPRYCTSGSVDEGICIEQCKTFIDENGTAHFLPYMSALKPDTIITTVEDKVEGKVFVIQVNSFSDDKKTKIVKVYMLSENATSVQFNDMMTQVTDAYIIGKMIK